MCSPRCLRPPERHCTSSPGPKIYRFQLKNNRKQKSIHLISDRGRLPTLCPLLPKQIAQLCRDRARCIHALHRLPVNPANRHYTSSSCAYNRSSGSRGFSKLKSQDLLVINPTSSASSSSSFRIFRTSDGIPSSSQRSKIDCRVTPMRQPRSGVTTLPSRT